MYHVKITLFLINSDYGENVIKKYLTRKKKDKKDTLKNVGKIAIFLKIG